ncbi:MAG: PAS domain S-box protein [Myxococcota bacterium]|nr:PAS domain S-box protein [Myxococcota bacterium]
MREDEQKVSAREPQVDGAGEARFRALADHVTTLFAELAADGSYLYASPSYRELLGWDPAELLGKPPGDLIHPDDAAQSTRTFLAALAGEGESHSLHRLRHRDGSWRWFDNTGRAFRTPAGELRFVSIGRDITERREAELALERQLDAEGRVVRLSQRFLARDPEELEASLCAALAEVAPLAGADRAYLVDADPANAPLVERRTRPCDPPAPDPERSSSWWRRLEDGEVVCIPRVAAHAPAGDRALLEARGVCSFLGLPIRSGETVGAFLLFEVNRGERTWSESETTPLHLAAELLGGALQRKRIEDALRDSRLQLLQAQKMDALGRLAGGVAHDFNNLLMAIGGFGASLVEELAPDHPAHEDALGIQDAVERATALTRQLLALSRPRLVALEPVELNAVVRGLEQIVARLLGEEHTLRVSLDPEVRGVGSVAGHLEQVLVNLVMNARDAMRAGGTLRIETFRRDLDASRAESLGLEGAGPYAELRAWDDGSGMDDEVRARVFEPFFTTKEPGGGTGLGLSVVYGIVRQSRGAIELASRPGSGTRVSIYLPDCALAAPAATAEPPLRSTAGSETVLIAEDEAPLRRIVRRTLVRRGYRVLEAADGLEALEVAAAHPGEIHALLSDVVMPRLGGVELARQLLAQRPDLRIVFLSGYPRERTDAEPIPTAAFVQKPCTPQTLLNTLRAVLGDVG